MAYTVLSLVVVARPLPVVLCRSAFCRPGVTLRRPVLLLLSAATPHQRGTRNPMVVRWGALVLMHVLCEQGASSSTESERHGTSFLLLAAYVDTAALLCSLGGQWRGQPRVVVLLLAEFSRGMGRWQHRGQWPAVFSARLPEGREERGTACASNAEG